MSEQEQDTNNADQQPQEQDSITSQTKINRLSKKYGGKTFTIKTYCLYFYERPQDLKNHMLCTGAGIWEQCPDFERCSHNKPPPAKRKEDAAPKRFYNRRNLYDY